MNKSVKNRIKMKIAVQLFGHMRTFEKCAPSLKKYFLRFYDCDLFIHTWSKLDHDTKTWYKRKGVIQHISQLTLEDKIQSLYQATRIKIEDQIPENMGSYESSNSRTLSLSGIKSMFYSMEQTNKLRESYEAQSKVKYDYVLMIRPDILLKKRLKIENYLKPFSEKEIENAVFSAGFNNKTIINELKFVGAIDVMFFARPQIIGRLVNDHATLYTDAERSKNLKKFGPEYILCRKAQSEGLAFYITDFRMTEAWEILRATPAITRKKIIRLHIKKNYTNLVVFGLLPQILQINITIKNYAITLALGE